MMSSPSGSRLAISQDVTHNLFITFSGSLITSSIRVSNINVTWYLYPPVFWRHITDIRALMRRKTIILTERNTIPEKCVVLRGKQWRRDSNSRWKSGFSSNPSPLHHYIDPNILHHRCFLSWILWSLVNIGYVWQSNQFREKCSPKHTSVLYPIPFRGSISLTFNPQRFQIMKRR